MTDTNHPEDSLFNLLMNMNGGLLPEHLSVREVRLLEGKYGKDWFTSLGYTDDKYERPKGMGNERD